MWSYSFEVPILMILAIILGFYFVRPRLPLKRNVTFIKMVILETLTIIADLAATMADNDYTSYSVLTLNVLNMVYFIAFFSRAYIMYLFSASVTKDSLEQRNFIRQVLSLPWFMGVILSILHYYYLF